MKATIRRWLIFATGAFFVISFFTININQADALSTVSGDGLLTYGQTANVIPQWRTYGTNTNTFGAPANAVTGTTARNMTTKTSPIKQEALSGYVASDNVLHVMCYNGTTWTDDWTVAVGGVQGRFDIAYEKTTGDAMVVYSRNVATTNEMAYRTKAGTSGCGSAGWATAVNIDPIRTSGTVVQVRLEASYVNTSDTIGLAWSDSAFDLSAMEWTGTSWAVAEPAAALETDLEHISAAGDTPSFDITMDRTGGNFYVVWGKYNGGNDCTVNTIATGCILYARYTAGAWVAPTWIPSAATKATVIDISPHPTSNEIVMGSIGENSGLGKSVLITAYWSGTAWTTNDARDTSTSTSAAGVKFVATGWLRSTGSTTTRSVIVYADSTAPTTNISWYTYSGATSSAQTDFVPAPTPGAFRWMDIQSDPFNTDRLMLVFSDTLSDLYAKQLVMDSTVPATPTFAWNNADGGAAALEANLGIATNSPFGFAYWRYIPSVLAVDIVDGAGTPVPSPSMGMSTVIESSSCQTTTGALGITGQRIRLTNTTASPAWTLSVSPTGGTTTNWSSGTDSYDFNDPSGSPPGCADGADTDSLAGQLSVDPSAGSITPKSGCTNTGISAGSSSAFNEGVIDSISLMTASASAGMNCYWDLLGASLSQTLPAHQVPGTYSLNMTMTVVAN
jgi:hypothetical protein